MLSIQPVNLTNQYSFRGATRPMEEDYSYSKLDYESDKSNLEGHLEDLNEIIENTSVPKPIRVLGKIASIGIGAGLGFVSMKFGAQGVTKLAKKGIAYSKELLNKPFAQKVIKKSTEIANKTTSFVSEKFSKLSNAISENAKFKAASEKLATAGEKVRNSKAGQKINDLANAVAESKVAQKAKEVAENTKTKIKSITTENVENAVVNLFAVSGGVTGGITALQESVRKDA